jgi:hypothetical protein
MCSLETFVLGGILKQPKIIVGSLIQQGNTFCKLEFHHYFEILDRKITDWILNPFLFSQ